MAMPKHNSRPFYPRHGVAVLMVLLLLAVTLAFSYAMVRLEGMAMQIQRNSDRREMSRQAALTGLALAITKMQNNAWAGVSTTYCGRLSSTDSFSVTYTVGDATLTSASTAYSEYPFRVTLESVGQSADPADATRVSSHNARAVMRLVPRQLPAEPTNWSSAITNTVYQTSSAGSFAVQVPSQTLGPIYCSSVLQLATQNGWATGTAQQYLLDIATMRNNGYADYRPFNGPIYLPNAGQNSQTMSWLTSMGTPPNYTTAGSLSLASAMSSSLTYRLYPGGTYYSAQSLGSSLTGVTYQADPIKNPLGFFVRQGEVDLNNNTTVQGSLVAQGSGTGEIYIYGTNVQLQPVDLPALYGSTQPLQLPVAMADDSIRIQPNCGGTITGLVTAGGSFEVISAGEYTINMQMNIRTLAKNFLIDARTEWEQGSFWWNLIYSLFESQLGTRGQIVYFPVYLKAITNPPLDYIPRLVIQPDSHSIQYHWKNASDPVYIANPSDPGLRWEVVSWTDDL
jgi:Tfp pilus assembly protein PilX